jgi:predicted RNA-binding protein with PIN domain
MPASTSQAILLVDGYNIIGAWPSLSQLRDRDGLEASRRALIETLLSYSASQDYDTHLVFDSQYRDTPGSREVITRSLCVCYTEPKQTADSYIEKRCADFRQDLRKFSHRIIVATSDRAQQLTVAGYGAEWISAQRLWTEVELTAEQTQRRQASLRKKGQSSARRFLANALDPVAQERLAKLRLGQQD